MESLALSEGNFLLFQPYERRILRVVGVCLKAFLGFDEMERWVVRSRLRNERSLILSSRTRLLVSVLRLGLMGNIADISLH